MLIFVLIVVNLSVAYGITARDGASHPEGYRNVVMMEYYHWGVNPEAVVAQSTATLMSANKIMSVLPSKVDYDLLLRIKLFHDIFEEEYIESTDFEEYIEEDDVFYLIVKKPISLFDPAAPFNVTYWPQIPEKLVLISFNADYSIVSSEVDMFAVYTNMKPFFYDPIPLNDIEDADIGAPLFHPKTGQLFGPLIRLWYLEKQDPSDQCNVFSVQIVKP